MRDRRAGGITHHAPATAPTGPSTTAPDTAPNAASPARSPALAAEDISARTRATPAIVFLIRVPSLSGRQYQHPRSAISGGHSAGRVRPGKGQMMTRHVSWLPQRLRKLRPPVRLCSASCHRPELRENAGPLDWESSGPVLPVLGLGPPGLSQTRAFGVPVMKRWYHFGNATSAALTEMARVSESNWRPWIGALSCLNAISPPKRNVRGCSTVPTMPIR